MERHAHGRRFFPNSHNIVVRDQKQSSSNGPDQSTVQSIAHEVQRQSDDKNMGGAASMDLNQILGHAANGAVKVRGDVDFVRTSESENVHTVTLTSSSSSHAPTSSSTSKSSSVTSSHSPSQSSSSSSHHHKSKHHGISNKHSASDKTSNSSKDSSKTSTQSSSSKSTPTSNGAHSFMETSNASDDDSDSQNPLKAIGGFYRIGLADGSKAERILPGSDNGDDEDDDDDDDVGEDDDGDSSTPSGARVAAVEKAKEPSGNLPNQYVITNNPKYGFLQAQNDLYAVRKWAGDLKMMKSRSDRNETIMALFNAASRYYPDVDTKIMVRVMLADIKAESDFESSNNSPGRIDSGNSVGLVQVSPSGAADELTEFKKAVIIGSNHYSWAVGKGSSSEVSKGGKSVLGPLMDLKTGKKLNLKGLSKSDLNRPWINLHVAMWLQSNYARTGSQDPSTWSKVAKASREVRTAYQPAVAKILGSSGSSNSSSKSQSFNHNTYDTKLKALKSALKSKNHQKPTLATALGSWVAGAAVDGGGYKTSSDDISSQYFSHISEGLSVMYTGSPKQKNKYGKDWLNKIELTPGLVDYKK
ncbi:hypothetical protein MOBT1_002891 [Malassezia obtusa]|uniref:Uncharacterized protein n=1 Tax=Malassezia obtusa TaxID=76774 RepID=A0AAF0E1T2_9BASI|nr:hypothetical protein MOBT1_002891 [Malassezia obtusa]